MDTLGELAKIMGIENQTRYCITYGEGDNKCSCEFSARMSNSEEELADLLEEFVSHLRADKTEVTTKDGIF